MTPKELKEEYEDKRELLHNTTDKNHILGAEKYMNKLTHHLLEKDPAIVEAALEAWGAMNINNFLTELEAIDAARKIVNTSGERAPKWDAATLFSAVRQLELDAEIEPYFNKWALFYTMNWLYSDYSEELAEVVNGDKTKFVTLIYKMAVKKLQDPDDEMWIRKHLELD